MSLVDMPGSNTRTFGPNGDAEAGPALTSNARSATSPTAHHPTVRLVQRYMEHLPRVAAAAPAVSQTRGVPGKERKRASALQRGEITQRPRGADHVEQQPQAVRAHGG